MRAFLVRRNTTDPTDEAYLRVFAHTGTPLTTLGHVAGQRWTVGECLVLAKGEVGLIFLVVVRQIAHQQEAGKNENIPQPSAIALTVPDRNPPVASRPPVAHQTRFPSRTGLVAVASSEAFSSSHALSPLSAEVGLVLRSSKATNNNSRC